MTRGAPLTGTPTAVEGGWLSKPCLFLHPISSARDCAFCEEPFTFWSGKKHCDFCGCLFHARCTSLTKVPGAFFRSRICKRCENYREFDAKLLREGDEFICYSGKIPAAARFTFSESTNSFTITMDPQGVVEEVYLEDVVSIQQGFSHAGHLRAATAYDPVRCFSVTVNSVDKQKCYDFKTPSVAHCRQWVSALNSAIFVSRRLQEQERTIDHHRAVGIPLPRESYLTLFHSYIPVEFLFDHHKQRQHFVADSRKGQKRGRDSPDLSDGEERCQSRTESCSSGDTVLTRELVIGNTQVEVFEQNDLVVVEVCRRAPETDSFTQDENESCPTSRVEVISQNSRDISPVPAILHSSHYQLCTGTQRYRTSTQQLLASTRSEQLHATLGHSRNTSSTRPRRKTRKNSRKSPPSGNKKAEMLASSSTVSGLPYRGQTNPLAINCTCHMYAIVQPQAMLYPIQSPTKHSLSSCCEQCRDKCKLFSEMDNF